MIKIHVSPCGLPMEPLVPKVPLAEEKRLPLVKMVPINGTIGRFADFTIGKTPNVAHVCYGHTCSGADCCRGKKVQVGKDQEKAQSEKDSHSKNRDGKKLN